MTPADHEAITRSVQSVYERWATIHRNRVGSDPTATWGEFSDTLRRSGNDMGDDLMNIFNRLACHGGIDAAN